MPVCLDQASVPSWRSLFSTLKINFGFSFMLDKFFTATYHFCFLRKDITPWDTQTLMTSSFLNVLWCARIFNSDLCIGNTFKNKDTVRIGMTLVMHTHSFLQSTSGGHWCEKVICVHKCLYLSQTYSVKMRKSVYRNGASPLWPSLHS